MLEYRRPEINGAVCVGAFCGDYFFAGLVSPILSVMLRFKALNVMQLQSDGVTVASALSPSAAFRAWPPAKCIAR